MAAVAAIVGARRGSQMGKRISASRRLSEHALNKMLKDKKEKIASKILATFDQDGSGNLCRKEVSEMIKAYCIEEFSEQVCPSQEDLEFIFKLCDGQGKGELNDAIDTEEILLVTDAWGEFMRHRKHVEQLFQTHDMDESGDISISELQEILDELKDTSQLVMVPPAVTEWVFKMADVSGSGALGLLELSRALCAFDFWLGKRSRHPGMPDAMLIGIAKPSSLADPKPLSVSEWKRYTKQKQQILELLQKHDLNGDSRFGLQEISRFLKGLGVTEEEVAILIKAIDANGDSVITANEFLNWTFSEASQAKEMLKKMVPSSGSSACAIS
eukprot:TRINITY_DN43889_c0_g1_i1.p1 TRINITY_DN43889_c0_g1~~TRINITY_DN43889_c0_g1_i1.p1  ORF type:complete len:356 (+),score=77.37 TRINITY_DN43889_c0_g1_i1:87-1070(+)